jgi:ferrochelatase
MRGVLLMNLGSPDSTKVSDVRKYLNEFLMDERVIDYPYLLRLLLVKGIIAPLRAPKSAEAYRSIWSDQGSPLIQISRQLTEAVQKQLPYPVEMAMRYGNPHPKAAFDRLLQREPGLKEVVLLPLYPHYAMSSYETAAEYAKEIHQKEKYPFSLKIIPPFYEESRYLAAMGSNLSPWLEKPYDLVLFSFHGIPERHVKKSDITGSHCLKVNDCCHVSSPAHQFCYRHQCLTTMERVVELLNIPKEKARFSFQSRLGRDPWLTPFTAELLKQLPSQGIKRLVILCPAFVSDCLETLEEIAEEGKEDFLHAGGEEFRLVPCLNTDPAWVNTVCDYVSAP